MLHSQVVSVRGLAKLCSMCREQAAIRLDLTIW